MGIAKCSTPPLCQCTDGERTDKSPAFALEQLNRTACTFFHCLSNPFRAWLQASLCELRSHHHVTHCACSESFVTQGARDFSPLTFVSRELIIGCVSFKFSTCNWNTESKVCRGDFPPLLLYPIPYICSRKLNGPLWQQALPFQRPPERCPWQRCLLGRHPSVAPSRQLLPHPVLLRQSALSSVPSHFLVLTMFMHQDG